MILSYFDNKKDGTPVLFIHGTASANEVWEEQYVLLDKTGYRVIGIDLRGHGKSLNPSGTCSVKEHIKDLKETIDYLLIKEPLIIVGHSFGAVLSLRFAEEHPSYISKLLLVSLPTKIPELLHKYYRWLLGKPIEYLRSMVGIILKLPLKKRHKLAITSDLNIVREIWKDSTTWDFLTHVPKVTCPIYLSVGRFDYVALCNMVKRFHEMLPNSHFKLFNWASHTCMEDQPREFNNWILSAISIPRTQHHS